MLKKFKKEDLPKVKDLILVDQADVEIIKFCFMNIMIDVSIGQVSVILDLSFFFSMVAFVPLTL